MIKFRNKNIFLGSVAIVSVLFFMTAVNMVFGQTQTTLVIPNPLTDVTEVGQVIDKVATWLFNIGVPIAVIVIVYAGVKFLLSRGKPDEVATARRILIYAVIGLLILFIGRGFETLVRGVLSLGG